MKPTTNGTDAPALLRGSWEDLLRRAQELGAHRNEDALPIYDKLLMRLGALPQKQRMAHDGRLQAIFEQAAVSAQSFLNVLQRYDEALGVLTKLRDGIEPTSRREIDFHIADVMQMAGRHEEAATQIRAIAEGDEGDLLDLGALCLLHLRQFDTASAQRVIGEMEAWIAEQHGDGAGDPVGDPVVNPDAYQRDIGYLNNVRSTVAAEIGEWADTVAFFEEAMQHDPFYIDNVYMLYTRLIRNRRYAEALPFVEKDKTRQIRPKFWRALALHHLGEEKKAQRLWQEVTETEITEQEGDSFSDVILAFYYMGDEERLGLELALRLINEVRNASWSAYFLVSLGWGLRDNEEYARNNLEMALQQRRAAAEGTLLTRDVRLFVEDLLKGETRAYFERFIETPPKVNSQ